MIDFRFGVEVVAQQILGTIRFIKVLKLNRHRLAMALVLSRRFKLMPRLGIDRHGVTADLGPVHLSLSWRRA